MGSELEMPKCEYCGTTRRECSGCGAEVGHTVIYANTRQADTTLERVKQLREWVDRRYDVMEDGGGEYAVLRKAELETKIDELFPELLEGQSDATQEASSKETG